MMVGKTESRLKRQSTVKGDASHYDPSQL